MPRILKNDRFSIQHNGPIPLSKVFLLILLKKQNFKRLKQRIRNLGYQHNYAGLFAPELYIAI